MAPMTLAEKIEVAIEEAASQCRGLLEEVAEGGDLEQLLNEFGEKSSLTAKVTFTNFGGKGIEVSAVMSYSMGQKKLDSVPHLVGGSTEDLFDKSAASPD